MLLSLATLAPAPPLATNPVGSRFVRFLLLEPLVEALAPPLAQLLLLLLFEATTLQLVWLAALPEVVETVVVDDPPLDGPAIELRQLSWGWG